jgi:hypothetical protein
LFFWKDFLRSKFHQRTHIGISGGQQSGDEDLASRGDLVAMGARDFPDQTMCPKQA